MKFIGKPFHLRSFMRRLGRNELDVTRWTKQAMYKDEKFQIKYYLALLEVGAELQTIRDDIVRRGVFDKKALGRIIRPPAALSNSQRRSNLSAADICYLTNYINIALVVLEQNVTALMLHTSSLGTLRKLKKRSKTAPLRKK